jgi:hypothetical protein
MNDFRSKFETLMRNASLPLPALANKVRARWWDWVLQRALSGKQAALYAEARQAGSLKRGWREILAKNNRFDGVHAGQRAFIIGNGSSLKDQQIDVLRDEITFVVSGFWKHPDASIVKPKYYVFADPLFFDGERAAEVFFENLRQVIHHSTYFIPFTARAAVEKMHLLPESQVSYIAMGRHMKTLRITGPDPTKIMPHVSTVIQLAILMALYMGIEEIYLLGLDHDWLAHREEDRHFYEGQTLPGHSKVVSALSGWPYKRLMEDQLKLWNDYEVLKEVALKAGCRIWNSTRGGFLDVFDRIAYEEVLTGKRRE